MGVNSKIKNVYSCDGNLLLIIKLLVRQPCEISTSQRENIFHTRCKILEQICPLIIDSGSRSNCCSTRLVAKLGLTIIPHPKLYKLQLLNEKKDIVVNQQVKVKFSIGNYKDNVLYDIVLMEVCHTLIGRS
uniref:Uncharacterized protein n=1 Tax=Cajanus cajan TaxID=3821 RepID=A0A151TS48_CAJCA|nr:hypothetical protein KK1_009081 [Cajanus cajan]